MKTLEAILLLSGGIDSTTLLAQLTAEGKKVHALSFNYGQRHSVELQFAQRNAAQYGVAIHHILKIDYFPMAAGNLLTANEVADATEKPNPNYVPGRNLLMLSHAAAYAEALGINHIYFAANADDGLRFADCCPEFLAALNQLWQSCPNTKNINVKAPFITLSKAAVIAQSNKLGVNLQDTISCYAPVGETPCGICLSCVLREEAIIEIENK